MLDSALDQVVDDGGTDTIRASFSTTLASGFENLLLLLGAAGLRGTGNAANNTITGNAGSNVLDGAGGVDTVSHAAARAYVVAALDKTGPQTTHAGNDTLLNFENLPGSGYNATLHGNADANVLNGGNGIDTVSHARATAAVTVSLALTSAQNTPGAGSDTLATFENLTGSGFADRLTGGSGETC